MSGVRGEDSLKEDAYFKKLAKLRIEAEQCRTQSKKLSKNNQQDESAKFQAKAEIIEMKIKRTCDKLAVHSGQLKDKECYYLAMGKMEKAETVAKRIKAINKKIKEYQKI